MRKPAIPPPDPAFDPRWIGSALDAAPGPLVDGKYLHWDELRHRKPPEGITPEQWWFALRVRRRSAYSQVPLLDRERRPFNYLLTDPIPENLHRIDTGAGAWVGTNAPIMSSELRDQYYVRSLMEEAITSSQLEGAATTRRVAKEMILAGRAPRNRSERMILNNYETMRRLRDFKDQPLTEDLVFEIHRLITHDTLDDPDGAGRYRRADENIVVMDQADGTIYHYPPSAEELPDRLKRMCEFANDKSPSAFLHPALRAIVLHFWLAYDHPFVDGNGRTARALFYWSMLRHEYWLFEFISISEVILRGPSQYSRAFLHTESDDNDLTYFIIYHLDIIRKSIESLRRHIEQKGREVAALDDAIKQLQPLNERQIALLAHALKHPRYRYTIEGHRVSHGVVYQTARTDLLSLVSRGLLESFKIGKVWHFQPAADLETRLHQLARTRRRGP